MELDNVRNSKLEAELFFSTANPGVLLYSKEELDDDNDSDDDKFVINEELRRAVTNVASGATIIDAEIDDNQIEVDAITTDIPPKEIELKFTMDYDWVSTETKYTYSTLPSNFDVVKNWFSGKPTLAPTTDPKVEIIEWAQPQTKPNIGTYYYEVEIDDYTVVTTEYEVEFYLDNNHNIIDVIVE